VLTGVCVANANQLLSTVVRTEVEFQALSLKDMEDYWATGEPLGKAGGYAIQGIAAKYVTRINGSYSNVVGLPLHETIQLLDRLDQCS
jgi:septum formation protein